MGRADKDFLAEPGRGLLLGLVLVQGHVRGVPLAEIRHQVTAQKQEAKYFKSTKAWLIVRFFKSDWLSSERCRKINWALKPGLHGSGSILWAPLGNPQP